MLRKLLGNTLAWGNRAFNSGETQPHSHPNVARCATSLELAKKLGFTPTCSDSSASALLISYQKKFAWEVCPSPFDFNSAIGAISNIHPNTLLGIYNVAAAVTSRSASV